MAYKDFNIRDTADLYLAVPDHWDEEVREQKQIKEKWGGQSAKEGAQVAIVTKTQLEKESGERIFIDIESECFQEPVVGETDSAGEEAQPDLNQVAVRIETYRFFESFTKKSTERAFINAMGRSKRRLSNRWARYKDTRVCLRLITPGSYVRSDGVTITPVTRGFFGGGANSIATLNTTGQLDAAELSKGRLFLQQQTDALPYMVQNTDKSQAEFFRAVVSEIEAFNLGLDPIYQNAKLMGLPQGWDNPVFTGADCYWDGMLIYIWRGVVQGCHQGSPWRPEVALVANVSTGDATIDVGLDDKKKRNYLENYPVSGKITITTPGGTDEEIEYNNAALTTEQKRYRFKLVGTLAQDHDQGNLITQENNFSTVLLHGAEILARADGKDPEFVGEVRDAGMQIKVGIEGVTGEQIIIDPDGNVPNCALLKVFSKNPLVV